MTLAFRPVVEDLGKARLRLPRWRRTKRAMVAQPVAARRARDRDGEAVSTGDVSWERTKMVSSRSSSPVQPLRDADLCFVSVLTIRTMQASVSSPRSPQHLSLRTRPAVYYGIHSGRSSSPGIAVIVRNDRSRTRQDPNARYLRRIRNRLQVSDIPARQAGLGKWSERGCSSAGTSATLRS